MKRNKQTVLNRSRNFRNFSYILILAILISPAKKTLAEESGTHTFVRKGNVIYRVPDIADEPAIQDAPQPVQPYFFPLKESLWDGYRVTYEHWQTFSTDDRAIFIEEYRKELEKKYKTVIDIHDWMLADILEYFDKRCREGCQDVTMTQLIEELFKERGKLKMP